MVLPIGSDVIDRVELGRNSPATARLQAGFAVLGWIRSPHLPGAPAARPTLPTVWPKSGGADGRESPHLRAADRWSRAGSKRSGRRFRRWPATSYQLKSYCSIGLSARRPGPHPMRPFAQPVLVDEDDCSVVLCWFAPTARTNRCVLDWSARTPCRRGDEAMARRKEIDSRWFSLFRRGLLSAGVDMIGSQRWRANRQSRAAKRSAAQAACYFPC